MYQVRSLKDEETYFKRRVASFKDHPALLSYYINDEMGAAYRPRLLAHQQWLEEGDSQHPSWEVVDAQSLEELGYQTCGEVPPG